MSRALSPSFARCYGLARVARVWKISRASVYRSLKQTPPTTITCRPGPVGAVLRGSGRSHPPAYRCFQPSRRGRSQVMAHCALQTSARSTSHERRKYARTKLACATSRRRTAAKPHYGTITTDKVNEMWGTDMYADEDQPGRPGQCPRRRATRHSTVAGIQARRRPIASRPMAQSISACSGASEPSRPWWRVD